MKYLLICFLCLAGCNGQSDNKQTVIDTVKLFDPHPETDEIGAMEMNIFKKNILLAKPGYGVTLNDDFSFFEKDEDVKKLVRDSSEAIRKSKFYIIVDSGIGFSKIKSVIDILIENRVTDYKVLDLQKFFSPPAPITVELPQSVTHTIVENSMDSTWLTIIPLTTGFIVRNGEKETKLKNHQELDEFIRSNKAHIKDISIKTPPSMKADKFKLITDILKKNDLMKFHLVNQ